MDRVAQLFRQKVIAGGALVAPVPVDTRRNDDHAPAGAAQLPVAEEGAGCSRSAEGDGGILRPGGILCGWKRPVDEDAAIQMTCSITFAAFL